MPHLRKNKFYSSCISKSIKNYYILFSMPMLNTGIKCIDQNFMFETIQEL